MGKSNVAEKTALVAEVVEEAVVIPTMTVVKDEKVEEAARKMTLEKGFKEWRIFRC